MCHLVDHYILYLLRMESACFKIAGRYWPIAIRTLIRAYRFVFRLRTFANRFHLTSAGGAFGTVCRALMKLPLVSSYGTYC